MLDLDKILTIALEDKGGGTCSGAFARGAGGLLLEPLPSFSQLHYAFPITGAGCLAAEEVNKDGEDPVRGVVEGDVSSNLILVLPLSVVTARVAWPPLSSILKKSSSKLSTSSLIFSVDI